MGGADAPPPRNLYAETRDSLQAQVDLAPELYAAEAKYQPQYASLANQEFQDSLLGTDAGTRDIQYSDTVHGFRNTQTGEFSATMPANYVQTPGGGYTTHNGNGKGVQQTNPWVPFDEQVQKTKTVNTPAQRGLLDIYANDIQPTADRVQAASLSAQRASDIADVQKLGPEATAAFKAANPQQAALLDEINRQALEQLKSDSTLDPEQAAYLKQLYRGGQAARGMGTGRGDAGLEASYLMREGNNMRQQRQTFATGVAGLNQATTVDPFLAITGRPATAMGAGNSFLGGGGGMGMGGAAGPRLFNAQNGYASDLFNTNYNAAAAANISNANSSAATTGAGVAGGAAIAGAAIIAL